MTKTTMNKVARKPTQRALDDWRTIAAARWGVRRKTRAARGEVSRSAGLGAAGGVGASAGRGTGRGGRPPGSSDIALLVGLSGGMPLGERHGTAGAIPLGG